MGVRQGGPCSASVGLALNSLVVQVRILSRGVAASAAANGSAEAAGPFHAEFIKCEAECWFSFR